MAWTRPKLNHVQHTHASFDWRKETRTMMFHIFFYVSLLRYALQKEGKMKSITMWIMMQGTKH